MWIEFDSPLTISTWTRDYNIIFLADQLHKCDKRIGLLTVRKVSDDQ